ncbi:class I SAM-dependent methyltransferase [Microbacterium arabinogalactanolyticum]|uniref:class I SAM-dependent methyltransferase n=1 Tax=Microbacterium arabinogalactanolyticum TaxID=69365 RepID=UPI0025537AF7|nr:class I SAM-dependent methyltransferase [Microbacterium arabinogalactanolyticum]GLC85120.1 methyltransferase type 11 [Microbacterium arabinogalactanolyticum]
MDGTFEELIADAEAADVTGWGFGWLDDRATEERPPWGYARLLAERWASARAALDLDTGGGEVLGEASVFPPVAVATEAWPPNAAQATARLHPRGVAVVRTTSGEPLPFADGAFDLVTSRHPVSPDWQEIARVLVPGGAYFAQHVGPASGFELIEYFLGPLPSERQGRDPQVEADAARAAGLEIVDLRTARLRIEIRDIGAVVYLLRKLVWWVPGFTVEKYRDRLRDLHEQIQRDGVFVDHSSRHLIEARRV